MMKTKQLLMMAGIFATAFVISCNDDEKTPPVENGNGGKSPNTEMVNVGTTLTFTDDNSNADSNEWSVSPASGASIEGASNEVTVSVKFNEAGDYNVISTRTFGAGFVNATNDTTFAVKVYDLVATVITANGVNGDGSDGSALTLENDAKNVVVAGQSVRFNNSSTGAPTGSTWTFEGGTPSSASDVSVGGSIDVKYATAGEYGVTVVSSRTAPASESTVSYTKLIKVVEPVLLLSTTSKENGANSSITLKYNKAIDASTLSGATFTVDVTNGSVDATIPVSGVEVDGTDASVLVVNLGEAVKSSDNIFLSYSAGSIADAVDGAPIDALDKISIANYKALTFGWGDFDDLALDPSLLTFGKLSQGTFYATDPITFGTIYINAGDVEYTLAGRTATAGTNAPADPCYSGGNCVRFKSEQVTQIVDMGFGDQNTGADQTITWDVTKTYSFSVMINVKSASQWFKASDRCAEQTEASCLTNATFNFFSTGANGWGDLFFADISEMDGQGWQQLSGTFQPTAASGNAANVYLRVLGMGEVLLDDLVISVVEAR